MIVYESRKFLINCQVSQHTNMRLCTTGWKKSSIPERVLSSQQLTCAQEQLLLTVTFDQNGVHMSINALEKCEIDF